MNTANFPRNRARKQAEALVRQAACNALPPEARLAALDARGFRAVKERAKLQKQIGASPVAMAVHGPSTIVEPTEPKAKQRRKQRHEKRGNAVR